MSGMTSAGNRPKDGDNLSETDGPENLNVNAPRELVVNESDFNETEVKELASKVSEVSLDEREAALFDIHGVAPNLEGDPEMLSKSLKEMNEMLTIMLCQKEASAFKLAESQSPKYTRNGKLLLMFLRCENFDVKAAATRMITFFQHKLSLFGPEKLCKDTIVQSDLGAEDLKCLTAGSWQLLPRRDHVGRAQLIFIPPFSQWTTHDNALKSIYYLSMTMLRDEETQKKGVVFIVHSVVNATPNTKRVDPLLAWKCMKLMRNVLPMRLVSHHICSSPTSDLRFFFSHVAKFSDSPCITRTRFHEGTFEEIEQQLAAFGINGVNLAISCEGDLKIDRHKGMLRSLKCLEAQTTSADDYVILPTHTDVLLGRGKPIQNHPGNLRVSLIVESLLQEYDGSEKRLSKKQLAAKAVDRMKGAGVRFLTKCKEGWKVAPDSLARERVISNFRTVRERLRMQEMAPLDSQLGDSDIPTNRNKRMLESG